MKVLKALKIGHPQKRILPKSNTSMSPCTPPYPEKVTNGSVTVFVLLGSKQTIAGVPQRIWNTIHLCLPILSQNPTKPPKSRFLAYKKNLDASYRPIQGSYVFRYFGVEFLLSTLHFYLVLILSRHCLHAFLQSLQRIQKVTWGYMLLFKLIMSRVALNLFCLSFNLIWGILIY